MVAATALSVTLGFGLLAFRIVGCRLLLPVPLHKRLAKYGRQNFTLFKNCRLGRVPSLFSVANNKTRNRSARCRAQATHVHEVTLASNRDKKMKLNHTNRVEHKDTKKNDGVSRIKPRRFLPHEVFRAAARAA